MNKEPYFSIHSLTAIERKQFSIVYANVSNTPEKIELAKRLFPTDEFHYEYHHSKKDLKPVMFGCHS